MLRENQVTLFDLAGTEVPLDLQRHVDEYADPADDSSELWKSTVIQLSIDLWASWMVHLKKSHYERPYHGAVHVEKRWVEGLGGAPPCVILSNDRLDSADERPSTFPQPFSWKGDSVLGSVECKSFDLEGCGTCFRLYLKSPPQSNRV
jgi:hypothetical protein